MAENVRTSITIDGKLIPDTSISAVSLQQSLNAHHSFELRFSQNAVSGILGKRAKLWIGKPITIGFDYADHESIHQAKVTDRFKGFVTKIGLSRRSGQAELLVSGYGPTYLMDDGNYNRSFTDKTPEEIIHEVSGKYTGDFNGFEIDPQKYTSSIPYLVQYREKNYAFLCRLANRFGEWCYYDGLKFHYGYEPSSQNAIKLDFNEHGLQSFDLTVQVQSSNTELGAYDYATNEYSVEKSPDQAKIDALGKIGVEAGDKLFIKSTPLSVGHNVTKPELTKLVARQEEVLQDEAVLASGSSRNPNLKLGIPIEVSDEELGENYGTFIITTLTHHIMHGGEYVNSFEAYPQEVETPPLEVVPTPPFCETQLAEVVNVNDDDGLGRVKVKFFWQENSSEISPFIRVASPYTGKDKGFFITPEVGDKVLVAFEGNSPDYPYVLTGMYHKEAEPEWSAKDNRFKGFKSKGNNQLKFDDKNKHVLLSAPSSMKLRAGKSITMETDGDDDSEIILDTGEGTIKLLAKDVIVSATGSITFAADENISSLATGDLIMNADQSVKAVGMEVSIKADTAASLEGGATTEVKSGGPLTVKGAIVQIN